MTHNGATFRSNDAQLDQRGMNSQFFFIRRHGPCIYLFTENKISRISGIPSPLPAPIKLWNFSNPNKYPHSVHWPHEKNLKSQKWPQNHSSWPKNIHKIFKLPKYSFSTTPPPPPPPPPKKKKIFIETRDLNPQNDSSLRMCENIRVHPPPGTGPVYMSTKYQG